MTAATEAVKEKAPEVSEQLGEAARRAGTVIGSAVRRDSSTTGNAMQAQRHRGSGIPAHSTHPETVNLGTSSASAASAAADVESDPALNDQQGQDWSDEGGYPGRSRDQRRSQMVLANGP